MSLTFETEPQPAKVSMCWPALTRLWGDPTDVFHRRETGVQMDNVPDASLCGAPLIAPLLTVTIPAEPRMLEDEQIVTMRYAIAHYGGPDCMIWALVSEALDEIAALRAERDQLAAVVAKLPKTADGVPVIEGMPLWTPEGREISTLTHGRGMECVDPETNSWEPGDCLYGIGICYSTRAAAEAARARKA